MEPIETFEHKGLTINIFQDEDCPSPRDPKWQDNLGIIASVDNRYNGFGEENVEEEDLETFFNSHKYAIYLEFRDYGSSGVDIRINVDLDRANAVIYTTKELIDKMGAPEDSIIRQLEGETKEYRQWFKGEVYRYSVEGEGIKESLWGMYDLEYCKTEAVAMAECCVRIEKEAENFQNIAFAL